MDIKINKSSRLRADGVKVVCVHRDDVDAILNFMIEKYNENQEIKEKLEDEIY